MLIKRIQDDMQRKEMRRSALESESEHQGVEGHEVRQTGKAKRRMIQPPTVFSFMKWRSDEHRDPPILKWRVVFAFFGCSVAELGQTVRSDTAAAAE